MFRLLILFGLGFFIIYGIFSFLKRFLGIYENKNKQQPSYNNTDANKPKQYTQDIGEYVSYEEVEVKDEEPSH